MMNRVRRATQADIPELVDLMREFYGEGGYPLDERWAATAFNVLLGDESLGAIWLAFEEKELAGHVVMTVRFSMEYGGPDAFVDDLFVRHKYRRRGLGKVLLQAVISECVTRGILALHVEVGSDNDRAIALYNSLGLRGREDDRLLLTARIEELQRDS